MTILMMIKTFSLWFWISDDDDDDDDILIAVLEFSV